MEVDVQITLKKNKVTSICITKVPELGEVFGLIVKGKIRRFKLVLLPSFRNLSEAQWKIWQDNYIIPNPEVFWVFIGKCSGTDGEDVHLLFYVPKHGYPVLESRFWGAPWKPHFYNPHIRTGRYWRWLVEEVR